MNAISEKREKEKRILRLMIGIYCHKKHKTKGDGFCTECQELADYAISRVEHCPHMADKTFCSCCETHCYKPEMREKIRQVMRFSGPRMIIYSPQMCIKHKLLERRKKAKEGKN